jgi:hypothetical protein
MNIEKKCLFCNQDIDLKKHGLTKYCSTQCRNKDYYQKSNRNTSAINTDIESETIANNNDFIQLNEYSNEKKSIEKAPSERIADFSNNRRTDIAIQGSTSNGNSYVYSLIERQFEARSECNYYKLKCEQLEKKVSELENDKFELNNKLESYEDEDNEEQSPFSNILGSIPPNIISGITEAALKNKAIFEMISAFIPKTTPPSQP